MSMEWFRWHDGTTTDPKLALIAKKSGQSRPVVLAVWAALLEQASRADDRGEISGFDLETIAVALDIEEDAIHAVIGAMVAKGMIEGNRITAWERRQPLREDATSTERVRAFRERQSQLTEKIDETQCNAVKRTETHGNAPDTDTDTDTEREKEVSQKSAAQAPFASPPLPLVSPVGSTPPATTAPKGKPRTPVKAIIAPDWEPADSTFALLETYGIDRPFAAGCIAEFRLYWLERGDRRPGWEASFVNNVKRQWDHRPRSVAAPGGGRIPIRSAAPLTADEAEWDAILKNLNTTRPVIEGEFHASH